MSDLAVPSRRPRPEKQGISVRMLAVAGGLLGAVALAGAVAWGVSRMGPQPVPVIEADGRPLKVRPENPGGMIVPNQDQIILELLPVRREAERRSGNSKLDQGPEVPRSSCCSARRHRRRRPFWPRRRRRAGAGRTRRRAAGAPGCRAVGSPVAAPVAIPMAPAPTAPAVPPRPVPTATGRATIQLGALATEEAARAEWDRVAKRVPELAGFQPRVTKLEREGLPPLFRLRAGGVADAAAAKSLCEAVKAERRGLRPGRGLAPWRCGRALPSSGSPARAWRRRKWRCSALPRRLAPSSSPVMSRTPTSCGL
ncbi:SPOR domain-containing protein [Dankookia sp. P2]|uniref:SPOR domain-containing protein n=1 Tax=Dankookia sp. P2 TaxID=3423955 RepID=UPI003D66F390